MGDGVMSQVCKADLQFFVLGLPIQSCISWVRVEEALGP